MPDELTCPRCGVGTKQIVTCPICEEECCVEACCPGGVNTLCLQCEEIHSGDADDVERETQAAPGGASFGEGHPI